MTYKFSGHAAHQMTRRRIAVAEVQAALAHQPRFNEPRRREEYHDPETLLTVIVDPYALEIVTVFVKGME